jgi:hypothetical protein
MGQLHRAAVLLHHTFAAALAGAVHQDADGAQLSAYATAAVMAASSVTSATANYVKWPNSAATAAPLERSRSTISTRAPPAISRFTLASQRPEAPPVTMATALFRSVAAPYSRWMMVALAMPPASHMVCSP